MLNVLFFLWFYSKDLRESLSLSKVLLCDMFSSLAILTTIIYTALIICSFIKFSYMNTQVYEYTILMFCKLLICCNNDLN